MKRSDDVFLFTLVDFLLQVFFFGLFLYVASTALKSEDEKKKDEKLNVVDQVTKWTGVSNITELTDLFTKMAPLKELQGISDFLSKHESIDSVVANNEFVKSLGGLTNAKEKFEEGQKAIGTLAEQGWGKTPCETTKGLDGKTLPMPIATLTVMDTSIRIESTSPQFEFLLGSLGLKLEFVRQLSLGEFRKTFSQVIVKQPECRHFVTIRRETQLYEPMSTVWSAFRSP